MRKLAVLLALSAALLGGVVATAGAKTSKPKQQRVDASPISYGVADDTGKYADDGGAWFDSMLKGANLTEERWTLQYTGSPTTIAEQAFLDRAAPQAEKDNVKVELALYGGTDVGNSDPEGFCGWAAYVAEYVQQWGIQDFIIWNEPNTGLYWKGAGTDPTVPAKYEALLASCYDKIKVANPSAVVIGFGLSPRKGTSSQTAPIPFIKAVGAAYVASGRSKPIMDMISVHPYPNPNSPTDSPDVGYPDPNNYGIPNLDRVKQAVYDAFNGTKQPTTVTGLKIVLDEVGWQTDTTQYPQYIHADNVKTVSEAVQKQYMQTATEKYFACDPTIATVNWFLLVDESTRDGKDANGRVIGGGWQSGILTAGGKGVSTPKQAYAGLAPDWAAGRAACTGAQVNWTPAGSGGNGGSGGPTSGGATTGTTTGTPTFDFSALNGLLTTAELNDLNWDLLIMNADAGGRVDWYYRSLWNNSLSPIVTKIENALGPVNGDALVVGLIVWAAQGSDPQNLSQLITPAGFRKLSHVTAGRFVVLSRSSAHVRAGRKINLKLKPLKKKVGAGSLYVVVGIRGAADTSKSGYLYGKLATIEAPKKKLALCKNGQKSTKTTPCATAKATKKKK
jgi:hypothetical protein